MENHAALATVKALLVESNHLDSEQVSDLLDQAVNYRFTMEHVECLEDAVAHIASHRPDIVVLGLEFADADGLDRIRRLCEIDSTLPVIVLAGHTDELPALEALRLGAQDFLPKTGLNAAALRQALEFAIARKQEERSLRLLRQQAEEANRAKSEFLANLSHELRTPLNAIMGFAEIIAEELHGPVGTESYRGYARDIHDSGGYLLSMMNGLLDLSKIEAGRVTLSESTVDVPEVIASAAMLVQETASDNGIRLLLEIAPGLPPLRADREKLQQVMINLLSNAIKFTPRKGCVTIGASREPDGGVRMTVADTGVGIAAKDIAQVLRPFGQVENSMNRSNEGAGLGIPLTERLVRMHDGRLTIDSTPGEGTCVAAIFPLERVIVDGSMPGEARLSQSG
jgi:signal transduction histidine kinase